MGKAISTTFLRDGKTLARYAMVLAERFQPNRIVRITLHDAPNGYWAKLDVTIALSVGDGAENVI